MSAIVVGVDDSDSSIAALRWAATEAGLRCSTLRVVHAWRYASVGPARTPGGPAVATVVEPQKSAVAVLDAALRRAALPSHIDVERVVGQGSPSKVLLDESTRNVELLVIGAHGGNGFIGVRVGSVAAQILHRASLPVVVVRSDAPSDL